MKEILNKHDYVKAEYPWTLQIHGCKLSCRQLWLVATQGCKLSYWGNN